MKCEVGDLAVIIQAVRPKNIGKIVIVEKYIGYFNEGDTFDFNGFKCTAHGTDHYWWVASEGLISLFGDSPKVYIPDTWLDPIRPKGIATDVAEDKELEVPSSV